MKRQIYKLLSESLGIMYSNGQIFSLPTFELETPKGAFGDYSTNVAFMIAKEGKFNAVEVATIIATELKAQDQAGLLESVEVVNGFLNMTIAKKPLAELVVSMQTAIQIEHTGLTEEGLSKKVLFEYSSPNTNKALHIGHTRNDVYGMACINILKALGHHVITAEVINDRGIHIMKSMLMYQKHGNDKTPESEGIKPDHFVGKYYVMFKEQSEQSEIEKETLEKEAQGMLLKWEQADPEIRALWTKMNSWFYQGVAETYAREGSTFDHVDYESAIFDKGKEVVMEGLSKGIFAEQPDGAVYVDLIEQGLDKKYLLRNDGTTIYITQDIYLWKMRNELFHPDFVYCTTSVEQVYHFQVLKEIFKLFGYSWAESFEHLDYGHVFLGKNKMSSRAGNTVSADDLLSQTKERVKATMMNSQKIKGSSDDEALVEAIAFAAIKYGYLKFDRNTIIYFDLEETVAIEGNTGPYLQYAYARIQSVIAKAEGAITLKNPESLTESSELKLMRMLIHYPEAVSKAGKEFKPNLICSYLFELAGAFNSFYDQVSILNAESEHLRAERLNLCMSVAAVLKHGLEILGIAVVEQM